MIEPIDITICSDTGLHTASFDFRSGILYARKRKLEQTSEFADVRAGTHFIVCCGDVMVKVEPTDFPEIKRRIL